MIMVHFSGLSNFLLENENKFNENSAKSLNFFIEHLQQPACLVAHNGKKFDFVMLKKELLRLDISLPDGLMCIDSLDIFRAIDLVLEVENTRKDNDINEISELEEKTLSALEELEKADLQMAERQKFNETTPHRDKMSIKIEPESKSSSKFIFVPKSKRRLDFETPSLTQSSQFSQSSQSPLKKRKFRLIDIYERFYSEPLENAHCAEDDCITLLKCSVACKKEFVQYAELNAIPFSSIKSNF